MNHNVSSQICFVDVGQNTSNNEVNTNENANIKQEPEESFIGFYPCSLTTDLIENDYLPENIDICKSEELEIKTEPVQNNIKNEILTSSTLKITAITSKKTSIIQRSFTCAHCNKIFLKRRYLLRHMRIHTGEKPYICRFCSKAFVHDHSMIRHSKLHTGERPFVCTSCDKVFITNNELKRHILIHTGEKPFTCVHCGKTFNRLSNLNSHKKIHFCLRPFKCQYCGKAFRENRYLKRHLKIVGEEKPANCTVCYTLLFSNACFNYHSSIHAIDKFLCDYCDRLFSKKYELRKHVQQHVDKMAVKYYHEK